MLFASTVRCQDLLCFAVRTGMKLPFDFNGDFLGPGLLTDDLAQGREERTSGSADEKTFSF